MKLFLLFITSLTILALGSCYKKENTTANIYVKDEANAFIEDAMVILYGENTSFKSTLELGETVFSLIIHVCCVLCALSLSLRC